MEDTVAKGKHQGRDHGHRVGKTGGRHWRQLAEAYQEETHKESDRVKVM